MQPLVLKAIISFAEERSAAGVANWPVPNVGLGIAMALGLWLLTIMASLCTHQVGMLSLFRWLSQQTWYY